MSVFYGADYEEEVESVSADVVDYEQPRTFPVTFVAMRLAEPPAKARSVFECLQACLRHFSRVVDQDVYVQQKYDGFRQLVYIDATGKVSIHNKNDVASDFKNTEILDRLERLEFRRFPRPCVLDTELVAHDAAGQVRTSLVSGIRHGTTPPNGRNMLKRFNAEFIIFDIYTEALRETLYSDRLALLKTLTPPANARSDKTRLEQNNYVFTVSTFGKFNKTSNFEEVTRLCTQVITKRYEGIVFRGASCKFACRQPGSTRRVPAYVAMKVKPMHLTQTMCYLNALGVTRSFRMLCGVPWYKNAFAKAQILESSNVLNRLWFERDPKRVARSTYGMTPDKPLQFEFAENLETPFVVSVVGDYRIESGVPAYSIDGSIVHFIKFSIVNAWNAGAHLVPKNFEELENQLMQSAMEAFTRPPPASGPRTLLRRPPPLAAAPIPSPVQPPPPRPAASPLQAPAAPVLREDSDNETRPMDESDTDSDRTVSR